MPGLNRAFPVERQEAKHQTLNEVLAMKQCPRCDQRYPDTENFCEMDGEQLVDVEDADEEDET